MKTSRRRFLGKAAAMGGASALMPLASCSGESPAVHKGRSYADYTRLDEVLKKPVLKRELFPNPVMIESLELLRDRDSLMYRVRSKDGAEGLSAGHTFIAESSYPMVPKILAPHFEGKDARDLDQLIYNAVEYNVKRQGIPLNVHVAGIEFAILDLLGTLADKPAGLLIGDLLNSDISIYLGHHLADFRQKEPEVSLELMRQDVEATRARAVKIRAGRGDNLGRNNENAP